MITLRLASMGDDKGDRKVSIIPGEKLNVAVERVIEGIPLGEFKSSEVFSVLVNGLQVEADFWEFTALKESDTVLVFPRIKDGDNGQIFKQVALVVITVVAAAAIGPGAGIVGALGVAAISIGAGLLLNHLIPPPVPESGALSAADGSLGSSQMYAVSGQSNVARKFNTVPKVYGRHRMFPIIAANPYTELEGDPDTGELAQYLYVIYDFGIGPMVIEDIKIGDTPIQDFSDVVYRLVDPNKPVTSEGIWDENLSDFFRYYKGDVSVENLAITLDGNREDGSPVDSYEVIRNSQDNTSGDPQTISVTMVNQRGLYGYSPTGAQGPRTIELEIYFQKVGETDWHGFNDPNFTDYFIAVGGDSLYTPAVQQLVECPLGGGGVYTELYRGPIIRGYPSAWPSYPYLLIPFVQNITYGLPAGTDKIILLDLPQLVLGAIVLNRDSYIGRIAAIEDNLDFPGYKTITLDQPLLNDVPLFYWQKEYGTNLASPLDVVQSYKINVGYPIVGKARISRNDTGAVYSTFKFTPKEKGQFRVKITRVSTSSQYTYQVSDSLTIAGLTTRIETLPIQTDKRHTFLEMRIRATNQLNGTIQNLSAVVTSVLDVWDGGQWVKQPSANPAWVFVDLLTGQVNKRAIDKSRLHLPSITEWADYCDAVPTAPVAMDYTFPRFECNFVLDYKTSLQSLLQQVGSAAQASLNLIDGKYGVLIDRLKNTPVQIFTPRNSKDFSSSRIYSRKPHGLLVKYVDPTIDWQVAELKVYDDGYDEETAFDLDELTSFACTNDEQAWRFGRYMLAQNRLRQENISITVDFEFLVCTRGDYVQITQDVMRVGGTPARVKTRVGNIITIDDKLEIDLDLDYGYVYRSSEGEILTDTLDVIDSQTFDINPPGVGLGPQPGDLVVIGEVGRIVYDCIVKSISPNEDLTATINLVEMAPGVYEAESTSTFPPYDPQISTTSDPDFAAPPEVTDLTVVDSGWECAADGYDYFAELDWGVPQGASYEYFSVMVNSGSGFEEVARPRESFYRYIFDETKLGVEHSFKVLAVSPQGRKLDLGEVSAVTSTPTLKTSYPSDVEKLSMDITGEVLQLVWPQVSDCDIREYFVRYSPLVSGVTWLTSIPLLRTDRNVTLASTQARTGTYLIKAVDFNGNESENPAVAITTIPKLFGLNVIDEITDFPTLDGEKDRTEIIGGSLVLQKKTSGGIPTAEYYEEGYYYYKELLDLGEIFTVRLQSLIQAEGLTTEDIMANWVTLSSVAALSNAGSSEWDVETQYRVTDQFNVIAEWPSLDVISQLNEGLEDNFSEWRKFIIGDATGRIIQFRLKLSSYKPSVSPRVNDGTIRADMPDRIESYNNLEATALDGYTVSYDPDFKGPGTSPNIQISIDGAQSGDYWTFDYKGLDGFTVRFYDKDDNPVDRTFDAMVKGYGRKAEFII